jgi:hypothetical protein
MAIHDNDATVVEVGDAPGSEEEEEPETPADETTPPELEIDEDDL